MSELNGFINLTQLRKMNQDTLKPVISQIQNEISKIKKQSQFLKQQSQKSKSLFDSQQKLQQFMLQEQSAMREVKIRLQELKDEDLKLMLNSKKQITFLNEQLKTLKRERLKYEEMITKQKHENDKVLAQFRRYQTWMDEKVQTMNTEYVQLKKQTLEMTCNVKSDYNTVLVKVSQLQRLLMTYKQSQNSKHQALELYLTERESINLKLLHLENQFHLYAPVNQIQYLRKCQAKQLEMTKHEVKTMLQEYLPEKIKLMLPQIQLKVKEIEKINSELEDIKANVFESQQEITHFKHTTQSLQSNFKKEMKDINTTLTDNIIRLQNDLQIALAIDQKQTKLFQQFRQSFTTKIQNFVYSQNQKTIQTIQQQTWSRLEKQKKLDQAIMMQQQAVMEQRCLQVKQVSQNIEKLLAGYNSRIVKIRSDTQLFKNDMLKQLKSIDQNRKQNKQRFEDIGKIIASIIQIITASLSVELNLDTSSLKDDNFAFSTYNDGLVYQMVPMFSKQSQMNPNLITYRRKQLDIPHLRRSLLTSVVGLIDKVYEAYPYLEWKRYKPSTFFNEQILQHYNIQVVKYGHAQQEVKQTQDGNGNNQALNESEQHEKISYRYNHPFIQPQNNKSTSSFRRSKISDKAYSPPRRNDDLNNGATINSEFVKYHQNDITMDEGIQLHMSHQNSFFEPQKENVKIKRPTKTIHEIHPRDKDNNRIISTSFHHNPSSIMRNNYKTIDCLPQSASGYRKKIMSKQRRQSGRSRYKNHQFQTLKDKNNDTETFMTSRSTRRAISIANYKIC